MFRPIARSHRRPFRRGTSFTLIVVVMISVMAAVGSGFVLFAMREARLGLARKESEGGGIGTATRAPDPTDTVNRFFGSLIYGVGDGNGDPTELQNGIRGHEIARSMYGYDRAAYNVAIGQAYNASPQVLAATQSLTTPWAGVGRFREPIATIPGLLDRGQVVNYTPGIINIAGVPTAVLFDPEYMGQRPGMAVAGPIPAFDPTGRTYVNKAAGYSFPDLKDFFAGALDPATGQVLLQSFHRPWLFGGLDAANPNWTLPHGRYMTLRPRPAEHPQFPRVPPNFDGSYTGDVQNWPGGYVFDPNTRQFHARNDSLWMNLGLPVITLPGNRRVQPLVAPLIIPVDGVFNASVHGNNYNRPNPADPLTWTHASYAGYAANEVNPSLVLGAESPQGLVRARDPNSFGWQLRNATNVRAYAPANGGSLPTYAPVAWNGTAITAPPTYPAGGNLSGIPNFAAVGFQTANAAELNHPTLFSPTEWLGSGVNTFRTFPLGDSKRLNRFGFTPDWYSQADVTLPAPSLRGTFGAVFTVATPQNTPAGYTYRLDPAHHNRALFTTRSYDLDRPKVVPSFVGPVLTLGADGKPAPLAAAPYPAPQATVAGSDFAGPDRWTNAMAVLGSVDINRPLADYRNLNDPANQPIAQPLSAANLGNVAQATADRQQLAADIFARLVAALGGGATVDTTTGQVTVTAAANNPQYNALRYLAQLSVNIVDYIDNDDVNTLFNWNRAVPTEIVYGVEKPRLVINEAYGELTNHPMDDAAGAVGMPGPTRDIHARFWVELLNPTTTQAPATGPLGTGAVPLNAYQIQIRREARTTGVPMANQNAPGTQAAYLFNNPANTTGSFDPTSGAPDATFTLGAGTLNPNDGQYSGAGIPAQGMVMVGPPTAAKGDEFNPTPGAGLYTGMVVSGPLQSAMAPAGGMGYTFGIPPNNNPFTTAEFKRHILLLRRLANPYLPFDAVNNPFISHDVIDCVPAFDAVHRGAPNATNRNPRDPMNMAGYDPVAERFSVGKVQPYAAHAAATIADGAGVYNAYTFAHLTNAAFHSMVLDQRALPAGANAERAPKNTFGRHNGIGGAPAGSTFTAGVLPSLVNGGNADTIMTPFDWLVHMDRPLVNQIELFQVRDTPSHRVSDQFVRVNGVAPGVTFDLGYARWQQTNNGIGRALEYLTVRPFTAGVAHGGRVPGKINLNAVVDRRVLSGLFDPQAGNNFGYPDGIAPRFMDLAWTNWMASRNGVTQRFRTDGATPIDATDAPGETVFDANTLLNGATGAPFHRPFMSFGAPAAVAGSGFAYGMGGTEELTVLRRNGLVPPAIYANATSKAGLLYPNSQPDGPSYMQAEPLRKITNNSTQVSHNYMVFLTIGYFDVVGTIQTGGGQTIPQLGAEAYIAIPGDMRQKAVAMIDMSNMGLDPVTNTIASRPATHPAGQPWQPFFTSLETTVRPVGGAGQFTLPYSSNPGTGIVNIAADGQEIPITTGTILVLGYGTEQQVVSVQSVDAAGVITVAGMTRTAWAGTSVSNVRPGYPGPQPNFSITDERYRSVVPYYERLR